MFNVKSILLTFVKSSPGLVCVLNISLGKKKASNKKHNTDTNINFFDNILSSNNAEWVNFSHLKGNRASKR